MNYHWLAAKLLHNVRETCNQALQVTQASTDHSSKKMEMLPIIMLEKLQKEKTPCRT